MATQKWTLLAACLATSAVLSACGDEGEVEYDPSWGESQLVADGKADLIDGAQLVRLGETKSGSVTSTSMDLFKIDLTNGDKIRATMIRKDGDLAPDASMFTRAGSSIRSADFSVEPGKLIKDYVVDGSTTYLLAARAFRNQGAGKYELTIECTGGPCNGEPLPPDPDEEIEISDIEDCISEATDCAFNDLPRWNGAVAQTRATNIFNSCLESTIMFNGSTCADVCDESDDAADLCSAVIRELPFYADQPTECVEELNECMGNCAAGNFGSPDELWSSEFAMCWENGFNSNCNSYAQQMTACGGTVQGDTAVCYEGCWASSGVWNDDLDVMCEEECGTCGIQCTREIDDWGFSTPDTGLLGDVVELFQGEVDPFVLGDTCLVYVEVHQEGDGELEPGVYGLIDNTEENCGFRGRDIGDPVHAEMVELEETTDPDVLDAANSAGEASRWFFINGKIDWFDI
jgi:hypothetical protein